MKKSIKVLLVIMAVILLTAGGLVIWQYDNITAFIKGLSTSSEDLAVKIDDHRNKVKTEIVKYIPEPIEDISAEDEKKLLSGEISLEEVADKYKLPIEYMKDEPDNKVPNTPAEIPFDKTKTIEKEIGDSIAQLYALKAKYVNKLGNWKEMLRTSIRNFLNLNKTRKGKKN